MWSTIVSSIEGDREGALSKNGLPPFGGDLSEMVLRAEGIHSGLRLDVFLSRCLTDRSRSRIQRWIQEGRVTIAGAGAKPSRVMEVGDEVLVRLPTEPREPALLPCPMPLDILFEDDHILVINKAPGLVVHPGAGHRDGTLVHGLLAYTSRLASQGAPLRPGIVHRLDRNTSGAMVIARSDAAYLDLIRQFKDHRVGKEYLAIVYGVFKDRRGEIRTGIDRHATDRKKMAVVGSRGREAVSRWEVEEDFGEVSFVRVCIQTGRTHQIRVHFNHLGHPVVGDSTYGGGNRRAQSIHSTGLKILLNPVDRQMLHAWKLSFDHPVTSNPLAFTADPPPDFSDLLRALRSLKRGDA
jgi:23S rRNA pseudouridine1911/1915/1917 synthase